MSAQARRYMRVSAEHAYLPSTRKAQLAALEVAAGGSSWMLPAPAQRSRVAASPGIPVCEMKFFTVRKKGTSRKKSGSRTMSRKRAAPSGARSG